MREYAMALTRRDFLASTGAAGGLFGFLGLDLSATVGYADEKAGLIRRSRITTTICPYCAVGCGVLAMSQKQADGTQRMVHVEGDPDHPISAGTLCPKGAALCQMANNDARLRKPLYRAPGATRFVRKEWSWVARRIAERIKKTRDESFTTSLQRGGKRLTVNRTTAIASLGSAALDNEECWLYEKMLRAMGLVYIEHQARI